MCRKPGIHTRVNLRHFCVCLVKNVYSMWMSVEKRTLFNIQHSAFSTQSLDDDNAHSLTEWQFRDCVVCGTML